VELPGKIITTNGCTVKASAKAGGDIPVRPADARQPQPAKPAAGGRGLARQFGGAHPYLSGFTEPFVLISTGTWCISLNPFNKRGSTVEELQQDCLCYMEYRGKPIKASRLFAGYEHETAGETAGGTFQCSAGLL